MNPTMMTALAALSGGFLVFIGGLIATWVSAKHNKVTNENQVLALQIKMINELQEERTHTENLLTEERKRRTDDIAAIDARFEKYKVEVRNEKNLDRIHIANLTNHINAGSPPPPPEPPAGYKP